MPHKPILFKTSADFNSRNIASFYGQIAAQKQLLQRVQALLPEALAKQALHCVIRDKKLLIYTDSPLWASQLRFYHKMLLASIRSITQEPVEIIQFKIMTVPIGPVLEPQANVNIPSLETIAIIQKQCQSVSDNQLKQALLKLSSTLKRLSDKS